MILLLCATDQERVALEKRLQSIVQEDDLGGTGWLLMSGLLPDDTRVYYCQTGMGKVNAAAATAIVTPVADAYERLSGIIHFGVAGGLQAAPGETIIAHTLACHDYGLRTAYDHLIPCTPGDLPAVDAISQPITLQQRSQPILDWVARLAEQSLIRMGVVATGDQFIQDLPTAEAIIAQFGADVIDMESYAVASVLMRMAGQVPWVIVRTASDAADIEARTKYLDNADNASEQAVAVVLQLVQAWPRVFADEEVVPA